MSVDPQRMLVAVSNAEITKTETRTSQKEMTKKLNETRLKAATDMRQKRQATRELEAETKKTNKKPKITFTFNPAPRVRRAEMPDGAICLDGVVLYPHQFFIMVDSNQKQHLVYIPGSRFVPGPTKEDPVTWVSRVVFAKEPGWYCRFENYEQEIFRETGKFHTISTLHDLSLKELWWAQEGCVIPPATTKCQLGEVITFPRIQRFFMAGDLVTLPNRGVEKYCVISVYECDKSKYYHVAQVVEGAPSLTSKMWVVGNNELAGPLISWEPLSLGEKWWLNYHETLTENKLFFKPLNSPFVRGNIIAVHSFGKEPEIARVVRPSVDHDGRAFFKVCLVCLSFGLAFWIIPVYCCLCVGPVPDPQSQGPRPGVCGLPGRGGRRPSPPLEDPGGQVAQAHHRRPELHQEAGPFPPPHPRAAYAAFPAARVSGPGLGPLPGLDPVTPDIRHRTSGPAGLLRRRGHA